MLLFIVKGVNLPTPTGEEAAPKQGGLVSPPRSDPCLPTGLSPSDLDAFVRFDFPYPNVVGTVFKRVWTKEQGKPEVHIWPGS